MSYFENQINQSMNRPGAGGNNEAMKYHYEMNQFINELNSLPPGESLDDYQSLGYVDNISHLAKKAVSDGSRYVKKKENKDTVIFILVGVILFMMFKK